MRKALPVVTAIPDMMCGQTYMESYRGIIAQIPAIGTRFQLDTGSVGIFWTILNDVIWKPEGWIEIMKVWEIWQTTHVEIWKSALCMPIGYHHNEEV